MSDPRLSGAARYAHDAELPGMWHAAFVRSPHPHARVVGVDLSEPAEAAGIAKAAAANAATTAGRARRGAILMMAS